MLEITSFFGHKTHEYGCSMIKEEDLLKIGKFAKPHGVKGEITLLSYYDISDITGEPYVVCDMDGIWVPFFIDSFRQKSDNATLIKFENIDSDEKVKILSAKVAYVPAEMIQIHDTDTDSLNSFIGYTVTSKPETSGESKNDDSDFSNNFEHNNSIILGQVNDADDSTDNILLKVVSNGNEILIPLALVTAIHHDLKTMEVSLPEGFLEI